jgi:hypothetical protein
VEADTELEGEVALADTDASGERPSDAIHEDKRLVAENPLIVIFFKADRKPKANGNQEA